MQNLYNKKSGVMELNIFNFKGKKVMFEGKKGLIDFYAPWCPPCRRMRDIWSELAIHFKNRFIIAAVNCEDPYNFNLRWRFDITCYPTLKFVDENGTLHDYKGDIDKNALLEFISERSV